MNVCKTELSCLIDSLCISLELFDRANKCLQIPLPKQKLRLDLQNRKAISLLITVENP